MADEWKDGDTMSEPRLGCTVCGKECHEVKRAGRGPVVLHEDGTEACLVDNCYQLERTPRDGEFHCDFCNGPHDAEKDWTLITRQAVVADMMAYEEGTLEIVGQQTHRLSEDWAACNPCHDLIIKGDWEGLADRCIDSIERMSGEKDKPEVRDELRRMVLEMWEVVMQTAQEWRQGVRGDER